MGVGQGEDKVRGIGGRDGAEVGGREVKEDELEMGKEEEGMKDKKLMKDEMEEGQES